MSTLSRIIILIYQNLLPISFVLDTTLRNSCSVYFCLLYSGNRIFSALGILVHPLFLDAVIVNNLVPYPEHLRSTSEISELAITISVSIQFMQ